jgi:hypothetical protein
VDITKHISTHLFMSILFNKIKFKININNDELLKIPWGTYKENKRKGKDFTWFWLKDF